jgi:glycosyltransferase involved in cell wall biosynthesis
MDCDPKRILIIDFCNFEDYQIGGHLSMVKNLMSAFGDRLALVGITTTKNDHIGTWIKKFINGVTYDFFALARFDNKKTKHFLPDRLMSYVLVRNYRKKIMDINIQNVFVQRHELLTSINGFGLNNICFCFPGLESPLKISKYWFSKYLETYFNKMFFSSFRNVKIILASGDEDSILDMVKRSNGNIFREHVIKFPTRINTDVFKPLDRDDTRKELNIEVKKVVVITTGRLTKLKGWEFMIDAYCIFMKEVTDSLFLIVGDGEDSQLVNNYVMAKGLKNNVILTGVKKMHEISQLLNASNLFIMGSYKEGWSTSLSEAIACGVPSCVTNFSSAKDIIKEGINGYVIDEHNTDLFAEKMIKALRIERPVYNENVRIFSVDNLEKDLLKIWLLI